MRRMKPVPTETYPITEYDKFSDGINLHITGALFDKIWKSPHSITLRIFTTLAGTYDFSGVVEIKMMPGKVEPGSTEKYSYFGTADLSAGKTFEVTGYMPKSNHNKIMYLTLACYPDVKDYPESFVGYLNTYEGMGYSLNDFINISIEPVSESNMTMAFEI